VAGNDGAAPARLAATILLRRGAEPITVQAAPVGPAPAAAQPPAAAPPAQIPGRLPRTGELPAAAIPGLLGGLALLAGGLRLRGPRR
jgi:hypothetical protein